MQASSAAPPGGGAPAASEELAQELVEAWGSQFKAHLLAPRFRQVAGELEVSDEVVRASVLWWGDGAARGAGFKDKDWDKDDMPNPGGYLYRVLPDLVQAFLDARDKQAAELGEDPATFNLVGWLRAHEDQNADGGEAEEEADSEVPAAEDRAEREAQEARERAECERQERADRKASELAHREDCTDHYEACQECHVCHYMATLARGMYPYFKDEDGSYRPRTGRGRAKRGEREVSLTAENVTQLGLDPDSFPRQECLQQVHRTGTGYDFEPGTSDS
jgi:hypothetical protein